MARRNGSDDFNFRALLPSYSDTRRSQGLQKCVFSTYSWVYNSRYGKSKSTIAIDMLLRTAVAMLLRTIYLILFGFFLCCSSAKTMNRKQLVMSVMCNAKTCNKCAEVLRKRHLFHDIQIQRNCFLLFNLPSCCSDILRRRF